MSGDVNALLSYGKYVYAGTNKGAFLSTDKAGSWTEINDSNSRGGIRKLATINGRLFASTFNEEILVSYNNGNTWLNRGKVCSANNGMVFSLKTHYNSLFASVPGCGVWRSDDDAQTWNKISGTLKDTTVRYLTISNDYLYVSVGSGGVWRRPISEVSTIPETSEAPQAGLTYVENHPNPFSSSTTFRFVVNQSCRVNLTICNALGNPVATLIDEVMSAGSYTTSWTNPDVASGSYFYTLRQSDTTETHLLLLQK